jgi:NAD-dependent dihydropyrimidine dehydrogenase PreA subunit
VNAEEDVLEELDEHYRLYLGIPRQLIPWYPTVDANKCVGCKECLAFCHDTVYLFQEESKKAVVSEPWHCQVYCQSCTYACPTDAISFPERRDVKATIRELRKKYPPA